MSNELVAVERQLAHLAPQLSRALAGTLPVERLMQTVLFAVEKNRELETCNRQSLFNAAMTFAVLGLEVDGVTGQGFLIPFKGVVQPVIGYLGYNTLGARAGMTITGRVVREGDGFEFDESAGVVRHDRRLGGEAGPNKRRIIAAWAKASAINRPAIVRVLSIDELLAVKSKSPRGSKPPWADEEIGFPAMCEKTAKRRLRRDMPMSVYQHAARMEEAHEEQGAHTWIHPDKGVVVDGVIAPSHNDTTPSADELTNPPDLREEARMAASRGTEAFRAYWRRLTDGQRAEIKTTLDMAQLQKTAEDADHEQST